MPSVLVLCMATEWVLHECQAYCLCLSQRHTPYPRSTQGLTFGTDLFLLPCHVGTVMVETATVVLRKRSVALLLLWSLYIGPDSVKLSENCSATPLAFSSKHFIFNSARLSF